ncbi:MAG TPA: ATP-binding protein [Streptosporangiaceae bacterium]|nr:ATP-binding protein [Streptosporangiaceae bacterium]
MSGAHPGSPLVPRLRRAGGEEFPSALPSWARAFPGTAKQAGAARRFVAGLLEESPFRDDAAVVLSELFTNALLHTASGKPGGIVVVQVSRWRHGVRIAVTDQGSPSQPIIRDPAACGEPAENGNGLYLAAHLARHLDWHDDASGRTIAAIFGQLPPQPHPCTQPPGPGSHTGFRDLPDRRKQDIARHEVPPGTGAGFVTVTPGRALIALFKPNLQRLTRADLGPDLGKRPVAVGRVLAT